MSGSDDIATRRVLRERNARKQAEALLEQKSLELFEANAELTRFAESLEVKVAERTRELEITSEKALAAAKTKSEFLAVMSHEIRTPMNGVLGTLDLLETTALDEEQTELLVTAKRSANSLLSIIDDILDFSKIDAGRLEIVAIDFDVVGLVEESALALDSLARDRNTTIRCEFDASVTTMHRADMMRLRQILNNLLSNAIKFTGDGEIVISVAQQNLAAASRKLIFRIKDTGIGIPRDKIEHIFDSFSQADASTTRQFGGTGLGLTICRKLCDLMGGEIGVTSEEGAGSEFWFTIATEETADAESANESVREHRGGPGQVEKNPDTAQGARVLLVEDNPTNMKIQSLMLRKIGVELSTAANGAEAVEQVTGGAEFDVVLMDAQMPVLDGYGATRQIRQWEADGKRSPVTIVALTANAMAGDRERCLEAGMNDYVRKPVNRSRLTDVINKWTDSRSGSVATPEVS